MKRINVNICALLVLTLAACTKSDVVDPVPTPSNTITFSAADMQLEVITRGGDKRPTTLGMTNKSIVSEDGVSSLPMVVKVEEGIHRAIEQKPATRAAAVTDANQISMLSAWASAKKGDVSELYIDDVDFTKGSDGIFRSNPAKLWLDAQTTLDFFVVANHIEAFTPNFNAVGDHIMSFDYTVPTDAANQPDLLVAEKLGVAGNYEESVPLDFKHVLAAVNIKVGSEVAAGTIQSIKFKGVYNKGTYLLDEHQWVGRTIGGNVVFNVPLPERGVTITKGEDTRDAVINTTSFMMIPQQLAAGAEVEVIFHDYTLNTDVTLRASIQGDIWAMNTTTNYLININGDYRLEIIPLDKVIDSHYVITKVEISSEYPYWSLSAVANDGADVTIQLAEDVNPMAKQGFWTDKIAIRNGTEYVITGNSARGSNEIDGSGNGVISRQVVYVFIPENVSGEDRKITLEFSGWGDNINEGSYNELTLTQSPVKWLDPTGEGNPDLFWGCELLIEGGQVAWGFNWNGLSEQYKITQGSGSPWGQIKNNVLPAMDKAGIDYNQFPDYIWMVTKQEDHKSEIILNIDYSKFATTLDLAKSGTDGQLNTWQLYKFDSSDNFDTNLSGYGLITSLKEVITALVNVERVTQGDVGLINTLDNYAALYALKRNRFHVYIDAANGIYLPILEEKDANWYLPAKDQFVNVIYRATWGQQFTWNDFYWTSTIHIDEQNPTIDSGNAYMFNNGNLTPTDRTNTYLAMAIRRKTSTADIVIKPEDVIIPGGGDNGGENGTIPGTGNQGGDIVTP